MNKAQSERARKAHEGYLALMAKRKHPDPPAPKAVVKAVRKAVPRWPVGSSPWIPSVKAEGRVREATRDILGDWTYVVAYWGDHREVSGVFEDHQLKPLDLS